MAVNLIKGKQLATGSSGIATANIADDAVTADKIADGAVGTSQLANDAVDATKIAAGAVGSSELATDAVQTAKIADAQVTAGKLASDAVTTAKILDANVTNAKLATGIDGSKITTGTVPAAQLGVMTGDSGAGGAKGAVPAPASGDAAALKFLKADGTWAVPAGAGGTPTKVDKNRNPSATSGAASTTGLTITSTPANDGYVAVLVNGIQYEVGDAVKTKDCFFSADGGTNARAIQNIAAGDTLYWNGAGSVTGFDLETSDCVTMLYNV